MIYWVTGNGTSENNIGLANANRKTSDLSFETITTLGCNISDHENGYKYIRIHLDESYV